METIQSAKRPREVIEQEDSITQIVTDFKKIEEPTVKDLSKFLVSFLEVSNHLSTRVATLENKVENLETASGRQCERMNHIEDQISSIESSQEETKKELNEKIDALTLQLNKAKDDLTSGTDRNASQIHYIQQAAMDCDIILKGFPEKPDEKLVVARFLNLFSVDPDSLKSSYYVSYHKQQKSDKDKLTESKLLHFVVLSFKTKATKIQIFQSKKKRGPLLLKELVHETSDANQRSIIRCTNKLSKFNLYVQQLLYKAKTNKIISEFKFHNHLFQYQIPANTDWIRLDTNGKADHLENQIPKSSNTN